VAGSASIAHSLRAWRVSPVGAAASMPATGSPALALEALVYGGGRYDGTLVRVRGTYRGANVHGDLPEATRRGRGDWVLRLRVHSHVPARPLDLVWRLEVRPAGDVAVCLVMQGLFNRAREPVSLALLGPLSATGACGKRFEVALGHLTIETLGQPVLDATLALPFSVEPRSSSQGAKAPAAGRWPPPISPACWCCPSSCRPARTAGRIWS
jgi:hypothetical protein